MVIVVLVSCQRRIFMWSGTSKVRFIGVEKLPAVAVKEGSREELPGKPVETGSSMHKLALSDWS